MKIIPLINEFTLKLYESFLNYLDDKFKVIFIFWDGAPGIKNYINCFPKAKFVLDPYHYI